MSALLFGRGGTYRLRWRHEVDTRAGEASEVLVLLADEAGALAFARRLAEGSDGQARLRAFLASDLGRIHQFDDGEVIRQLAVRLASKRILAARTACEKVVRDRVIVTLKKYLPDYGARAWCGPPELAFTWTKKPETTGTTKRLDVKAPQRSARRSRSSSARTSSTLRRRSPRPRRRRSIPSSSASSRRTICALMAGC